MTTMKAALAAGTTTTYSTTGTTLFCIKGKAYSKGAVTNGATPTTDFFDGLAFTAQTYPANSASVGTGSVYVFGYDSGGTIRVCQGSIEQLDISGNFVIAPQFPPIPDTMCPFGYLLVRLGPTAVANWTFGTNNLSSVTGVTYTFVDVMTLPDRPQIS